MQYSKWLALPSKGSTDDDRKVSEDDPNSDSTTKSHQQAFMNLLTPEAPEHKHLKVLRGHVQLSFFV
ncbi:hypothetical protein PC116_g27320 [Phytophthora cactorum]|nr:hypothetical protein PC114_g26468 [Phytophthora cactorum]KAG4037794.1 hypothetical protein PC123_g26642 [Phytophthora cactorum]KAG4224224.1 hypothetical protein PC116_g27320 [Phytophthora cactorum]